MQPSKTTISILLSVIFTLSVYSLFAQNEPNGWILDGSQWESYKAGIDSIDPQSGSRCAYIKSIKPKTKGFGTLIQATKAQPFHGKRIRLSAYIKTRDVIDWSGLWMRIDDYNVYNIPLGFDNMADRPIVGTTKWTKYEIVLDVPENASKLVYGILLSETGKVWIDNVVIEEVDKSVPTTNNNGMMDKPINLDFEE